MSLPLSHLKRYPIKENDLLQAFDSADELLLEYLTTIDLKKKRILIVNDQFGALSCSLNTHQITTYTDSFVSYQGIKLNSHGAITAIPDLEQLEGSYDFVLVRIPKSMSFFEDILARLTKHLHQDSQFICASMVKHLAPTSFDLLQKYIGQTTTSLAKKKARLVFAKFEKASVISPYPIRLTIEGFNSPFINHSNLFSREKLDIGTRFFLDHLPQGPFEKILDLGCANGIIGIKAQQLNPKSQIIFSDESFMAIKSATANYKAQSSGDAEFVWTNCYENQGAGQLDLVLCNPPFHQGTTIGDFIAWQMFKDAHYGLKAGGLLRVIGNHHLGYQVKLKKIFGNSRIVATNSKFIICEARK
ncbi:MAG: methyltransferase [Bacteriovoracaceae bacterium]